MRLTLPTLVALLVLAGAGCRPAASNHDSASDVPPDTLTPQPAVVPPADTSAPSKEVELRTDKTHYRAGAPVTLTIVNKSTSTFAFNPCPRVIERQVARLGGRDWVAVQEPPRMCTMEAWILKAHETRTAQTKLSDTLPSGRVRIVVGLSKEGQAAPTGGVRAISPVLTIDP